MSVSQASILNETALRELRNGNVAAAQQLLERAVALDAANTRLLMNLAGTLRQLGRAEDEMRTLERVLAVEPRHLFALLQKAALLESQGKQRAAAKVYHNALQTISPGASIPVALHGLIDKAIAATKANDAALDAYLNERLQELRKRYAGAEQDRFDHCIDAFLGKRRIFAPQPTFLNFPQLPAREFYARAEFPWLDGLEGASTDVRAEFERVLAEDAASLEPYVAYPQGVPLDQWAELNHSRRWSVFYLWRDGKPMQEHLRRCPRTAQLLASLPLLDIPGYAPTVFFSILDAKSHIPAHTGVTNTRLIVHLPLIVPPACRFRVGSTTREWRPGEALVFDDSIEHEAWNDSDTPRAILIFDIWNPYLTSAERDLLSATVTGIAKYYDESAQ
ncbi:MAG TPA: aspartyl/asparaginyl beta-hydroxylase domain-containing protein [Steroidobacteraceae bacterium]|nr:aspartyl/asparaginyl beta-hydroxylase domain-containing protein [Steroidobacteraceae bacterium]